MSDKKIIIVGDRCIDVYKYGVSNRLSPEKPVPVFEPTKDVQYEGMAANVLNNFVKICVFNNYSMVDIRAYFSINNSYKIRLINQKTKEHYLRMDVKVPSKKITLKRNIINYSEVFNQADIVLISDYDKGFVSIKDLENIRKNVKKRAKVYLDTKKILNEKVLEAVDFVKLNEIEYQNNAKIIGEKYLHKVIITLGEKGAMYKNNIYEADKVKSVDVSGAGDTFFAAFAFKHMITKNVISSIKFANKAAGQVVQKEGVTTISSPIDID